MDFTNDILLKMHDKRALYNPKFSKWYLQYYLESGGSFVFHEDFNRNVPTGDISSSLFNRSERIRDCMDLWLWDKYEKNKILDLVKVNRCMNSRFCPNCKMLDVAKFIHKSRAIIEEYKNKGYSFYMLTLTVPSVEINGLFLKKTIEKLSICFAKFFTKFGYEDGKAYKDRFISIFGGIRVLEITCNEKNGFHPHLHCIVLLKDEPDEIYLEKNIKGKFRNKSQEFNMLSLIDLQIAKIWGMIWYGKRLTKNNIVNYVVDPKEVYVKYYDEVIDDKVLQVDFRPLDEAGIFEVFKYTFKSSEIASFDVFKGLVDGLENKRIRQGFGVLYNVKVNDDELEEGELQGLELAVPEEPVQLLTTEILSLVNEYGDYKKISRFNPKTFNVDEYIRD